MMRVRSLNWQATTLVSSRATDETAREEATRIVTELGALAGTIRVGDSDLAACEQDIDALSLRLSKLGPK